MNINPYQILHLQEDATYQEIKQRYRHLTINLHPDKQPLQNYQLAHKHFKQIDEAYKSISSQLRRFIFKQFGPPGIILMSMYPYLFKQFQDKDINNQLKAQEEVKQLVLYLIHDQHASTQSQQKNMRIMSVIILYWPLNNQRYLPAIHRCNFEYQMPLPQIYGFSQTLKIGQSSRDLGNNSKSSLQFVIGMTKRIRNNTMLLMNNFGISGEGLDVGIGVNWVINQGTQVLLNLINAKIKNDKVSFQSPQVGVNFYRQDVYFGAKTSINDSSFEIGTTGNQKDVKKNIRFGFEEDGAAKVTPTYQKQIDRNLRLFVQYNLIFNNQSFGHGLMYGYRLKAQQMGLFIQIASIFDFSHSSRLQISLATTKFKVALPIMSKTSYVRFQLFKIAIFGTFYFLFKAYNKLKSKTTQGRNKLFQDNYNRLINDRNIVNKMKAQIQLPASISLQKQIQLQGLIIIGAYLGQNQKIKNIQNTFSKLIIDFNQQNIQNFNYQNIKLFIQKQKDLMGKQNDQFEQQVYQITNIVQANIVGAQLKKLKINQLNINPCIDQYQQPQTLIIYWIRGKIHSKIFNFKSQIKIAQTDYSKKHPWYLRFKNKLITKIPFLNL